MTDETPTARIKRIEVVGLFGLYNHVIDLKLEDRVTILHGPNGVGKTTLLQLIYNFVHGRFDQIVGVHFEELRLTTTDGLCLSARAFATIDGKRPKRERPVKRKLEISATRAGQPLGESTTISFTDRPDPYGVAARLFTRSLSHRPNGLEPPLPSERWYEIDDTRSPLLDHIKVLRAQLITADRLVRPIVEASDDDEVPDPTGPAIWQHAAVLKQRIAEDWIQYGEVSQHLDRTYPSRLLLGLPADYTMATLKPRMEQIENRRNALRDIGLIDEQIVPFDPNSLDRLPAAQLGVMGLYVQDTEKKLATLDPLAQRLSVLLRIVNARFRNKSVLANPQHGLIVLTHEGHPLPLDALSSGEQHQIILLHDLLFRMPPGTLVLIDEPELSLHVLWQERVLPDLLEIVNLAGIDILLATHSPEIIGDRTDLTVALSSKVAHAQLSEA